MKTKPSKPRDPHARQRNAADELAKHFRGKVRVSFEPESFHCTADDDFDFGDPQPGKGHLYHAYVNHDLSIGSISLDDRNGPLAAQLAEGFREAAALYLKLAKHAEKFGRKPAAKVKANGKAKGGAR